MLFKTNRTGEKRVTPLMLQVAATPGLYAGTKIATRHDWTPVEQLSVGDMVLTAEHGEQAITSLEVTELEMTTDAPLGDQWPVHVPEGILGNSNPLILAPDMHVVIEDEAAGLLFGHTCVSLKAEDLIGYRGIARARLAQPMTRTTLEFEHGVSLVVEGGVFLDMPSPRGARRFTALDARQARLLVRHMSEEDHTHRSRKVASGWI